MYNVSEYAIALKINQKMPNPYEGDLILENKTKNSLQRYNEKKG